MDAINTDTFYGADPGCAKMANIDIGEEQFENNVRFRRTTYEIHFNRDGWEESFLNRGAKFLDENGNLVDFASLGTGNDQALLKQDGTLLNGVGYVKLDSKNKIKGDQPNYLNPPRYKKLSFGALNLEYTLLPIS